MTSKEASLRTRWDIGLSMLNSLSTIPIICASKISLTMKHFSLKKKFSIKFRLSQYFEACTILRAISSAKCLLLFTSRYITKVHFVVATLICLWFSNSIPVLWGKLTSVNFSYTTSLHLAATINIDRNLKFFLHNAF